MKHFRVDFIGVGAARSGTSWVTACLREHPEIAFSLQKEVCFFNKEGGVYEIFHHWNYPKGILWYRKQFPKHLEGKKAGEFSVDYLPDKMAPKLIKKHFPGVKLIVCLRNPIEAVYSHYWWYRESFRVEKAETILEAIRENPEYVRRHRYYSQLKRYYNLFSQESIHIIIYDDIKNSPERVIRNLYKFIGVSKDFTPSCLYRKVNTSQMTRSSLLTKIFPVTAFFEKTRFHFLIDYFRKTVVYQWLHTLYVRVNNKPLFQKPPLTKKETAFLKKVFSEDIKKTDRLIKRDLSVWLK